MTQLSRSDLRSIQFAFIVMGGAILWQMQDFHAAQMQAAAQSSRDVCRAARLNQGAAHQDWDRLQGIASMTLMRVTDAGEMWDRTRADDSWTTRLMPDGVNIETNMGGGLTMQTLMGVRYIKPGTVQITDSDAKCVDGCPIETTASLAFPHVWEETP